MHIMMLMSSYVNLLEMLLHNDFHMCGICLWNSEYVCLYLDYLHYIDYLLYLYIKCVTPFHGYNVVFLYHVTAPELSDNYYYISFLMT